MRRFVASLVTLSIGTQLCVAQQQILVPTRPLGDNTNAAASTAFVQNALAASGGLTQSANTVFAGPASGAASAPTFRALVTADIPSTLAGGSLAASALTLESTSGVGTSDFIQFLTGSQVQRGKLQTDGSMIWSTGTASIGVDTYNGGSNTGQTAFQITNSDNSALSLEHYTSWIGATTNGTGNGAITATSFALGLSAIKNNWTTTTTAGEYVALNVVARGGDNNVLTSGDVGGITVNAGASFSNNFVTQFEGVSGYLPGGSTTNSLDINIQLGSIRASGLAGASDTGIGYFAQAQNGLLGNAIELSNLCTTPKYNLCSKWLNAFVYTYDDGTHAAYQAFVVNQTGQITSGGAAANGQLTLNGTGGGNLSQSVSATGGHLFWASSAVPTLTAGCNGAGSSISGSDTLGTVVGQTAVATSCTVTWGVAYAVAPRCIPTGRTTPVTSYSTSLTTLVINFASTASAIFDWTCYGA